MYMYVHRCYITEARGIMGWNASSRKMENVSWENEVHFFLQTFNSNCRNGGTR